MFFKNHLIAVAFKFLWVGLVLGLAYIVVRCVYRLSKDNVYVHNLVSFCFWLVFGMSFSVMCISLYNCKFCWFGLVFMILGMFLVKFSIDFFFTRFARLLYNKHRIIRQKGVSNGRLQTKEKV